MIVFFEKQQAITGIGQSKNFFQVFAHGLVFPPQQIFGKGKGWYIGWVSWVEIYYVNFPQVISPSDGYRIANLPIEFWQTV